jgi:hypothetical protein
VKVEGCSGKSSVSAGFAKQIMHQSQSQSQSYFTTGELPPSVLLGDKPLETHVQKFYFSTEHLRL